MHVAVVGAGALGAVYGARLIGEQAGTRVTFVVRDVPSEPRPLVVERVESGSTHRIDLPERVSRVPEGVDAILVCVRYEQLDAELARLLRGSEAPVVTLTPLLPKDRAFLQGELGKGRVFAAMPSVVGYRNIEGQDSFRYWLPKTATTLIADAPEDHAVTRLAALIDQSGISCKLHDFVFETNVATTLTFVPLTMGLDVAGGAENLLRDGPLFNLVLSATRESRAVARRAGRPTAWAEALAGLASGRLFGGRLSAGGISKRALRLVLAIARRRAPEGFAYFEEHFGRKLHAQNVAMCEGMVSLAVAENLPHDAIRALYERLRSA